MKRLQITLKGIVQGVGFRPFVYNLARDLGLKGTIKNTSDGLVIDVEGLETATFIKQLAQSPPPLARIEEITYEVLPLLNYPDLKILPSENTGRFTLLSPDISICEDCLRELFDPKDRRYQYPFINCTNCGPRYTITLEVPYDRPKTTMAVFQMCPQCLKEYNDPTNRRFHAQPNACPDCGPSLSFVSINGPSTDTLDPLTQAIQTIKGGGIVAIRGLGGFHLCCDAEVQEAVRLLRRRKRRSNKPFAIMLPNPEHVRAICELSPEEVELLVSNRRPIVLLRKLTPHTAGIKIAEAVSPGNGYFGCMLPYTPLHYLLFYYNSKTPLFRALVMTSANVAEEPIVKDNEQAIIKLSHFADGLLLHNRDIFMGVDDSVVKVINHEPQEVFIRRARGYVPEAITIASDGEDVLGVGADIKNAFAITKGRFAIIGQHIGDMENEETLRFFEEVLNNLSQVYNFRAQAIGYDMHPDYLSARWAKDFAKRHSLLAFALQHHHCHIASVIAEHGLQGRVLGAALDGAGYGTDGNLWGSEFLLCEGSRFERLAAFEYMPMPGGDKAAKECWRPALGLIRTNTSDIDYWHIVERLGFIERYGRDRLQNITQIIDKGFMTPLSSGAGRLFDAVAAIVGCCEHNTFEGEAAMVLEGLLNDLGDMALTEAYPYLIKRLSNHERIQYRISFRDTLMAIIEDLFSGLPPKNVSLRFHNTLSRTVIEMLTMLSELYDCQQIALSGGVWQNSYMLRCVKGALINKGLKVYCNTKVPTNDGGIALGQVYIVRELMKGGTDEQA